jgi:hypothetical protein
MLLAGVLVIILLVATTCGGGGGGGGNAGRNNTGTQTPTTSPSNTPTQTTVPACDPAQLKLTVSTDTTTYTVQQAPKLIGTLANPDGPTCKLARSADQEIWTVKSGTPTVWSTDGCSDDTQVPKSIKLAQGGTKQVSIFWNGKLRTSSCVEGDYAQRGTYVLDATLDGVTATHPLAVFRIRD